MSLGGQEDSAAVIVYGPDGKAYGSPAQARAAGVSNPTMSAPAGVPIQYPGLQPYTPTPLPSVPTPSSGERNRYAEIMSQFGQSQPFSFFGMPSGGFNPYASDYTGGFTPYQRPIPAPASPVQQDQYAGLIQQPGGGASGSNGGRTTDFNSEWSGLSDEGKAAFYAESPGYSKATQIGQDIFGFNKLGMLQKATSPDFVYRQKLIAQGIDPAAQAAADISAKAARDEINRADAQASGGNGGGSGYSNANAGNYGWTRSGGGEGGGWAQGGHVSMMHLQGPNPMGPDDGYGALKDGEYVINNKAVNKYGIELMNAINSGKISKGKLRGLLEM